MCKSLKNYPSTVILKSYTTVQATPAAPERRTSFDQELVGSLEKQLNLRPKKDELVDRNILKGWHNRSSRCMIKLTVGGGAHVMNCNR